METKPTAMTDANRQKLKEAFLFGCTLEEAALYAGISTRTLFNWRDEDEEFAEEIIQWRNNPTILARKTVYDKMADNGELALKYLERKKKDEFSLKTESKNEHEVKVTPILGGISSNELHTNNVDEESL